MNYDIGNLVIEKIVIFSSSISIMGHVVSMITISMIYHLKKIKITNPYFYVTQFRRLKFNMNCRLDVKFKIQFTKLYSNLLSN